MVIKNNLILVCEKALIGQQGKVSFIDIFEKVFAENVPALRGDIFIAASFIFTDIKSSDTKAEFVLSIKSPSNKEMLKIPPKQERQIYNVNKVYKTGIIFGINNVVFGEFGKYIIKIFVNNKEKAKTDIEVIKGKINK